MQLPIFIFVGLIMYQHNSLDIKHEINRNEAIFALRLLKTALSKSFARNFKPCEEIKSVAVHGTLETIEHKAKTDLQTQLVNHASCLSVESVRGMLNEKLKLNINKSEISKNVNCIDFSEDNILDGFVYKLAPLANFALREYSELIFNCNIILRQAWDYLCVRQSLETVSQSSRFQALLLELIATKKQSYWSRYINDLFSIDHSILVNNPNTSYQWLTQKDYVSTNLYDLNCCERKSLDESVEERILKAA